MREISNREIGSTVRQKLNRALTRVHDIRDYGAVGDGVTDDRAAIVAAIAAATANDLDGVAVYIPATADSWYCSAGVTLDGRVPTIIGDGYASRIRFGAGGFLRNEGLSPGGYRLCGFEKVSVVTLDESAWAIEINCVSHGFFVRDTHVSGDYCVKIGESTFDWVIDNLACRSSGGVGTGLQCTGHGAITGYSSTGCNVGVSINAFGISVAEARIEECRTGIIIGDVIPVVGCHIAGITIESCLTGIDVDSAGQTTISGAQILGYSSTSYGPSEYGIRVRSMSRSTIESVRTTGTYTKAGVEVWQNTTGLCFDGVTVDDNSSLQWDFRAAKPRITDCDITDHDPNKTLRTGSETVAAAATEHTIAFPAVATGGLCDQNGAPVSIAGTLPNGDYEYSASVVDARGVLGSGIDGDLRAFTATAGGARLNFYNNVPDGVERRIYRRMAGETEWLNYFVQQDSGKTFDDTGQDFDGHGNVPIAGADLGLWYGSADYRVTLSPEFECTAWVKERNTDSIVIGLSAGHGGGTLRWTLEN